MPRRYRYETSPHALLTPTKGLAPTDFFEAWDEADFAEPHLLCAEMCRLAYATEPVVTDALTRIGWTRRGGFGGVDLRGRFAAWGGDGFVATGPGGRILIAFRGTESNAIEDVVADLLTRPVDWEKGGQVHEGFAHVMGAVRGRINEILAGVGPGDVLITGHSLGAAVATLAASELTDRGRTLVTFGSPLVGDAAFAAPFANMTVARFVDCCDLVARVPPEAFDPQHVADFFMEIAGLPHFPVPSFGLGLPWRFQHVSPPRFIDPAGQVHDGLTPDRMREERAAARRAYGGPGLHLGLDRAAAARGLLRALRDKQQPREDIKETVRGIMPALDPGRVPLRDLADHAPLNYIRGMAHSFRGQAVD